MSDEDKWYKISNYLNYNDIGLQVIFGKVLCTEEEAISIANRQEILILNNGFIEMKDKSGTMIISDYEKERYYFEVCKKETPILTVNEAKDILAKENGLDYLFSDKFMTTAEDYVKMPWSISQAYNILQSKYPEKQSYKFDFLSYGYQEVNTPQEYQNF